MLSPRYSLVICTSIATRVRIIVPNNGWNGSRGWKSIGPFFTWTMTFGANLPSSGANSSYACLARSVVAGGVDEGTPDQCAIVRRKGCGEHVRAVGMRAPVGLRARLALGIRLHEEAAEVGNEPINLRPPLLATSRARLGRAGPRCQTAELDRAEKRALEIDADAVGPPCVRKRSRPSPDMEMSGCERRR